MPQTNKINTTTLEAIRHIVPRQYSFFRTPETNETQVHRILSANWVKHAIYRRGWESRGGGSFYSTYTSDRRHLPRSLPIQTQGNSSQPRSHGAPYRGDHGSRLVRHGPGFLAGAEVDGIGGRGGGAGEGALDFNRSFRWRVCRVRCARPRVVFRKTKNHHHLPVIRPPEWTLKL